MPESSQEPWKVMIGAATLSLVVILTLSSCSLPSFSLGLDGDVIALGGLSGLQGNANLSGGADVEAGEPGPDPALVAETESALTADQEGAASLAYLNHVRVEAGLMPLVADDAIARAAQAHADYLKTNGAEADGRTPHEEFAEDPGFTGEVYWQRMEAAGVDLDAMPALGEVVATHPRGVSAVVHWLDTAYHRLPLLSPDAAAIGYGHVFSDRASFNVMNLGALETLETEWPPVVLFPPPGAVGVPVEWDGLEAPRPPAPGGGFPSGPVVSINTSLRVDLQVSVHELRDAQNREVPHKFLTRDNDDNLKTASAALLYADDPLEAGSLYRVRFAGTLDGVPFDERWEFETAPRMDDCVPLRGDCGAGRACYHLVEPLRCHFVGALPERAPCKHANDCGAGLTCFRGSCQAYCGLAEREDDGSTLTTCDDRCPWGWVPLLGEEHGLGLCLPPRCDPHENECGPDRFCTWGGVFVCDGTGSLAPGDACDRPDGCVAGSSCLDLGDGFRCRQLCAVEVTKQTVLEPCTVACPGSYQAVDLTHQVAVCP